MLELIMPSSTEILTSATSWQEPLANKAAALGSDALARSPLLDVAHLQDANTMPHSCSVPQKTVFANRV